jgi:hypothetical protein
MYIHIDVTPTSFSEYLLVTTAQLSQHLHCRRFCLPRLISLSIFQSTFPFICARPLPPLRRPAAAGAVFPLACLAGINPSSSLLNLR